jgi:hypothetical protein
MQEISASKPKSNTGLIFAFLGAITLGVLAVLAWPHISYHQLTGHVSPIRILDTLQSPVAVTGWSDDGLSLVGGRTVQLPGFRRLPAESAALTDITRRGVEVSTNGRVYGLVKVHHWCGNDPVEEHIARVDVADVLMFLREGEWANPPPEEALLHAARTQGGRFSQWGWNVGEFGSFRNWRRLPNLLHPNRRFNTATHSSTTLPIRKRRRAPLCRRTP